MRKGKNSGEHFYTGGKNPDFKLYANCIIIVRHRKGFCLWNMETLPCRFIEKIVLNSIKLIVEIEF